MSRQVFEPDISIRPGKITGYDSVDMLEGRNEVYLVITHNGKKVGESEHVEVPASPGVKLVARWRQTMRSGIE